MKYTIHGYSQERSIKSGLDYLDLGILRWIQDFYPTMKKTIFQNKEYGWFSYSYFLNELPIMGINTKTGLRKRIDKIIDKGFIERTCIKDTDDKLGTRSWVRLTEKMLIIISQTTVSTGDNHSFHPVVTTVSTGDNHSFHNSSINNPSINDSSFSINDKDTASGFSQNDFLENFIKERLSKMLESEKAGYYAFTVTQLESLAETLGRPLTQMECQERCKMVLDKMYPEDENPVVKDSFTTQNPTVKESLTVQKPKKEVEIIKKDDIESFVRKFKANEFEVDGVIQFQSVFSENEIELITKWILRRKETHKSKVKNTEQAITGVLNDILDIKKEIPLEIIFEQRDGCYVYCGASGDASKTHQSIKLEYFTKLIKKPTFNNQYAKPKLSMSESADLMRQMAQYTKEQQEQLNQKEYEYPF